MKLYQVVLSLILSCFALSFLACDDTESNTTLLESSQVTFENASEAGDVVTLTAGSVSFNMIYANPSPGSVVFPTGTDDSTIGTLTRKFFMSETEVTYELWYNIYTWAISRKGAGKYDFSITTGNEPGAGNDGVWGEETDSQEPVTRVSWRQDIIWCNALTEYYNSHNGSEPDLECVYYTDADYTTPLRTATSSTAIDATAGSEDTPYIKASSSGNTDMAYCTAGGFRLPTSMEWEYAARYRSSGNSFTVDPYSDPYYAQGDYASGATKVYNDAATDNATYAVYGGSSTAAVKSKVANGLGLYDMSGNVNEYCFDWYSADRRQLRGGDWWTSAVHLQAGSLDYSNTPYDISNRNGFRMASTGY